jgi:DNA-directed RNA polymerase, mitochondrial
MPAEEALAEEIQQATKRFEKQDGALVKAVGAAASAQARAIAREWLPVLTEGLVGALNAPNDEPKLRTFIAKVIEADHAKRTSAPSSTPFAWLALCLLDGALQGAGRLDDNLLKTALRIAENIYIECFAAGLFKHYHSKHKSTRRAAKTVEVIEAQSKGGQFSRLRKEAAYDGYKVKDWSEELRLLAGNWGVDKLLEFLPGVFQIEKRLPYKKNRRTLKQREERVLRLTPEAITFAASNVAELIRRNPVWLPKPEEPAKWEDWNKGGTSDKRLIGSLYIISRLNEDIVRAVRKAIRSGTMQPTLDALNALQAVPWRINKPVLAVLQECALKRVAVDGVPAQDSVLFETDIQTARAMAEHDHFWTPMNLDFRGRVYGMPHFNFQRDERVRALFLFADGEPIGHEGLKWLKVHVANRADSNDLGCEGISKRPFDERTRWVDEHLEEIKNITVAPLKELQWTKADKPFLFLAACFELTEAIAKGPEFVSRLPISFDGSCNGLQHLSAMLRDEETAEWVNLIAEDAPQDIYERVAKHVSWLADGDQITEDADLAKLWLKHGISRKRVKRNVMAYFYGSEKWGMAEQQREDFMRPLTKEVESGKRQEHPFGEDEGNAAAKYLASRIHFTIEKLIKRPAGALEFLQKVASAVSNEGLYLHWTTPVGFPWTNRYYKQKTEQVRLYLRPLETPFRIKIATGEEEPQVDKSGAKNGVAANFVHACDAAHLMLTVNAAVAEGITSIATVHDSFGCLPAHAERFRQIIREQFVQMYKDHDVLQEVLDWARKDLKDPKGLPNKPPEGSLDVERVLGAEYAFA